MKEVEEGREDGWRKKKELRVEVVRGGKKRRWRRDKRAKRRRRRRRKR